MLDRGGSRLEIAAIVAAAVAVFADTYATQPLLPMLSRDFGVNAPTAGLTISVVVAGMAIASALLGSLSDIVGRKTVMVISGALITLATFACAAAPSFGALLAARTVQGLVIPGIAAVAVAYIGDRFSRDRIAALVGIYIACTALGGLLGRVVAGLLAERYSWRAPFAVYAAFTLLATVLMLVALRPDRRRTATQSIASAFRPMLAHIRHRGLLGAFTIGMLLMFAFIGIFTYLPYKLSAAPFSLSTGAIALFYLSYIAGVVISPIAGRLADARNTHRLISLGIVVAIAGCLLTTSASLALVAGATALLCIGMFTVQSIAPGHVNVTATTAKGAANSLYQLFYYCGSVAGSILPGLAFERWGWNGTVGSCIAALVLALGAVQFLRTGETIN